MLEVSLLIKGVPMQTDIIKTTEERLLRKLEENRNLLDQVIFDLETNLTKFKDPKKGMKLISRKTGVHEKTLGRILAKENKPGYITLYKIYRYLLETENDTEVVEKAPKVISDYLKKQNPKPTGGEIEYSAPIAKEIQSDRAWTELFFMAGAGKVTRDEVRDLFGSYGIQTVEKMKSAGVLNEIANGVYTIGSVQANLTSDVLKTAGIRLTETFFNPGVTDEAGENHIALYAEGLNETAYNEWLKIDEEAFRKKVELSNQESSKGSIRAFTFMVIDKMQTGKRLD